MTTPSTIAPRRGRAARREARLRAVADRVPFLTRRIGLFEILDSEGIERIEDGADTILKEIGMEFRGDPEVLDIWRLAGADVEAERVRFEPGMLRAIIRASAPTEFVQHARNPANSVTIGGNGTVFVPAYGSPFVHDLERGRRYATIEDFRNFVRLTHVSPWLHHSGGTVVEPVDLPVAERHLDMVYSHIRYGDRCYMGSVTAGERAEDSVAMTRLVFGEDFVDRHCCIIGLINVNSPLVLDTTMLAALKVYARHGQGILVTPFILTGAMGPITEAGAVAQLYAEAMAGIALTQLIRPGSHAIFGSFTSSMSMLSGAPTFGTPEANLALYAAAQLARRLGVPFRAGGHLCASKVPDAQAIQESCDSMMSTLLAGVHFVMHSAGWLEGGLAMSYEKFVLDHDHLGMLHKFAAGIDTSENSLGLDAVREVGPGSHFMGCAHTRANYEHAFYQSEIADNNSFEQWQAGGSLDAAQRAAGVLRKKLAEYQAPAIDGAVDEALIDFIRVRKGQLSGGIG